MQEYNEPERPSCRDEPTVADRRSSHVSDSLLSIDEEGKQLVEAIRELDRRLSDVLQPEMDSPEKMLSEPRAALVPLAERITAHGGTVRMARQYVVSILERLEL